MSNTFTNSDNVIDVRDIIKRYEELEDNTEANEEEREEFNNLQKLLNDLEGNGGDEQFRDEWYPLTLIRDSYFKDYAKELAEDIGAISKDTAWPNNCIDWIHAANQLRADYTSVKIGDTTYWYR